MLFDSHVETLLSAAVGLVNSLTPGHDGTVPVQPPDGGARAAVVGALQVSQGRATLVDETQAAQLTAYVGDVRRVFEAAHAGEVEHAAAQINHLLASTGARPQLDPGPEGWGLHFHGADDGVVLGWAAGFASALALCLGSDLAGVLGVCSADPCDRVFVDGSKNGTRRYCSTRCQSRVKAAAHRRRQEH